MESNSGSRRTFIGATAALFGGLLGFGGWTKPVMASSNNFAPAGESIGFTYIPPQKSNAQHDLGFIYPGSVYVNHEYTVDDPHCFIKIKCEWEHIFRGTDSCVAQAVQFICSNQAKAIEMFGLATKPPDFPDNTMIGVVDTPKADFLRYESQIPVVTICGADFKLSSVNYCGPGV